MPTLPQAALATPREAQRDVALSALLGVLSLAAWAALWAWSASPYARYAAHGGWLDAKREREAAAHGAKQLEVKMSSVTQQAGQLSGGNQQKVVLAKWLGTHPRVLILDEPTRGIDVGTKAAVHALMSSLAAQGMAILMISSELPEILGMSDRILVMREGRLTGQFSRAEATQEQLMAAAAIG